MIPTEILKRIGRKAQQTLRPKGPAQSPSRTEPPPTVISPPTAATPPPIPLATRPSVFDTYTSPGVLSDLGVLFMPLAEYHGRELGAIATELHRLERPCSFLVQEQLVEVVDQYLGDFPRVLVDASFDKHALGSFDGFVAMNDWGEPSREMYHLARVRGASSFAKVEGVQDFTDVDTGRIRLPYLAADHVLVQGENDIAALDRKNLHLVGNANMEAAWAEGPIGGERNGEVVVNSNFTYGVLTEVRNDFLTASIEAITFAGYTPVISQHPADVALPAALTPFRTNRSMSSMLLTCEAVVTRFSTVPFEAIAYGTPFIYFNPHHEQVPTFRNDSIAFEHVHNAQDLASALDRSITGRTGYRERAEPYFRAQIDMADSPSAARAAAAIDSILEGR